MEYAQEATKTVATRACRFSPPLPSDARRQTPGVQQRLGVTAGLGQAFEHQVAGVLAASAYLLVIGRRHKGKVAG